MNNITIGLGFITIGLLYSLLAWDAFYNVTLGFLVKHEFIRPPRFAPSKDKTMGIGRKANIIFYGVILIIIGLYIIFFSKI